MSSNTNTLIHLSPLPFSSLPSHPSLDSPSSSRPSLHPFLTSALSEAHSLLSSIPSTFHHPPKPRSSPPASSKVHLSTSTRPTHPTPETHGSNSNDEFWVCRQSIHSNSPREGTASWDEFRRGLAGENHSENEADYTPTISGIERLVNWDVDGVVEGGWVGVNMHVNLITHTFQPTFLISPRTFISLVISAHRPDTNTNTNTNTNTTGDGNANSNDNGDNPPGSFITVQIPLTQHPRDSIPPALWEKIIRSVPGNTIFAAYASVEQVVFLPKSESNKNESENGNENENENENGQIKWTMATTSNAGGSVPQWVQRSWTMGGVPKAIVADVGLFIGWVARNRS